MGTGSIVLGIGAAILPDGSASNLAPAIQRVKSSAGAPSPYFLQAAFDAAQIESLPFSLAAWFAPGQPRALWLLDQSDVGQAVIDMTGRGANQNAITGTAVAAESVPVFNYGIGPALERIAAAGGTLFEITLSGSSTPTGTLTKQAQKTLSGAATPTGAFSKLVGKLFSGASTPTGALILAKVILLSLSGSSTPTGTLARQVNKGFAGLSTPVGSLLKLANKSFAGASTPIGSLAKLVSKFFSGVVAPIGALLTQLIGGGGEEITITLKVAPVTRAALNAHRVTEVRLSSAPVTRITTTQMPVTQATLTVKPLTFITVSAE